MAKRKTENNNQLIVVGAAVAMIIAVAMFGGQITGKAVQDTATITFDIAGTNSCILNTDTVNIGTITAGGTANVDTTLVMENNGNTDLGINASLTTSTADGLFGGTSSSSNYIRVIVGESEVNSITAGASPEVSSYSADGQISSASTNVEKNLIQTGKFNYEDTTDTITFGIKASVVGDGTPTGDTTFNVLIECWT